MAATYAALADPVSAVVDLLDNNWTDVASGVGTTHNNRRILGYR